MGRSLDLFDLVIIEEFKWECRLTLALHSGRSTVYLRYTFGIDSYICASLTALRLDSQCRRDYEENKEETVATGISLTWPDVQSRLYAWKSGGGGKANISDAWKLLCVSLPLFFSLSLFVSLDKNNWLHCWPLAQVTSSLWNLRLQDDRLWLIYLLVWFVSAPLLFSSTSSFTLVAESSAGENSKVKRLKPL